MSGRFYSLEGMVINRRNFGEADRLITIFPKKQGKTILLAPGVRKITSRRGPKIEFFNLVSAEATRGKTWDILTEAESKKTFPHLKKDLKRINAAYQLCELTDRFIPEGEENETVFDLLLESLTRLDEPIAFLNFDNLLFQFKARLLIATGFWPKDAKITPEEIDRYIEKIIQGKIRSAKIKI